MEYQNSLKALPVWESKTPVKVKTGMQYDAPFIFTRYQERSDLGDCVISTFPPHYVCKLHSFRTHAGYRPGKDAYNEKQLDMAQKGETERIAYLQQRFRANEIAEKAEKDGVSVRDIVEHSDMVYDEEFDEPRLVAKIPGLNAYLEFYGCLDKISPDSLEWDGEFGVYDTIDKMATWAQNIWTRVERRPRASKVEDNQPLQEWCENYDETLRPFMQQKRGIGQPPLIDLSRRPEMLYSNAPKFDNADIEMIREIKAASAYLASHGIKQD